MLTGLLLIRHGEVPPSFRGRYIGRTDPPLDPAARTELERHREEFRNFAPEALFVSPLRRALETAEILGNHEPPFPLADPRLREIDFGDWENLTFDEILRIAPPGQIRLWAEKPEEMQFPGGESFPEFARRTEAFLAELLRRPLRRAAVVTHGGVIAHLHGQLRKHPAGETAAPPPRGSFTRLEYQNGEWIG